MSSISQRQELANCRSYTNLFTCPDSTATTHSHSHRTTGTGISVSSSGSISGPGLPDPTFPRPTGPSLGPSGVPNGTISVSLSFSPPATTSFANTSDPVLSSSSFVPKTSSNITRSSSSNPTIPSGTLGRPVTRSIPSTSSALLITGSYGTQLEKRDHTVYPSPACLRRYDRAYGRHGLTRACHCLAIATPSAVTSINTTTHLTTSTSIISVGTIALLSYKALLIVRRPSRPSLLRRRLQSRVSSRELMSHQRPALQQQE